MPLPDYTKTTSGSVLTFQNSGGSAVLNLISLANGNGTSAGARQSATLDLGSAWAQRWRVDTEFEFATAPTSGNSVLLFGSYANSSGAGLGATSGSDAAYTGYSNNIDASVNQLEFIGAHVCTAQATSTVQKALAGVMVPKGRYLNLVVNNKSGVAFHSSGANIIIRLTPLEDLIQENV